MLSVILCIGIGIGQSLRVFDQQIEIMFLYAIFVRLDELSEVRDMFIFDAKNYNHRRKPHRRTQLICK